MQFFPVKFVFSLCCHNCRFHEFVLILGHYSSLFFTKSMRWCVFLHVLFCFSSCMPSLFYFSLVVTSMNTSIEAKRCWIQSEIIKMCECTRNDLSVVGVSEGASGPLGGSSCGHQTRRPGRSVVLTAGRRAARPLGGGRGVRCLLWKWRLGHRRTDLHLRDLRYVVIFIQSLK